MKAVAAAHITRGGRAFAIGRLGYYSAPEFGFRRDREAFPLQRHKMTSGALRRAYSIPSKCLQLLPTRLAEIS
jgi:hypothetical protein